MANPLPDEVQDMVQPIPLQIRPVIVGGFSDISVDDEDVKKIAEFAVASMNERENSKLKLVKITEAASQVVAGRNYKLKLELLQPDGDVRACEVIVFDQPWTNTRMLNQINCVV
jgi:Aspartic acid proteinase inhibitor